MVFFWSGNGTTGVAEMGVCLGGGVGIGGIEVLGTEEVGLVAWELEHE